MALFIHDEKIMEREFGNLVRISDNYRKTVITYDTYSGNSYQGIELTDLKTFLSE
jgi:predicted AAA+ superfamily ATPase